MPFDSCEDDDGEPERSEAAGISAEQEAKAETEAETALETPSAAIGIPFVLVLRKWVEMNPSVEFRCFVRSREILAICQRDLNHFDFLFAMVDSLRERIQDFFQRHLKDTFPDDDFVFDVYMPPPHKHVWLIDINPWAPSTDPLLFSWLELLRMEFPEHGSLSGDPEMDVVPFSPEFRLIKRDDPEAYSFTTPQYSAHKLPKDVVDASLAGPGPLREFADQWKAVLARQQQEQAEQADLEDDTTMQKSLAT